MTELDKLITEWVDIKLSLEHHPNSKNFDEYHWECGSRGYKNELENNKQHYEWEFESYRTRHKSDCGDEISDKEIDEQIKVVKDQYKAGQETPVAEQGDGE